MDHVAKYKKPKKDEEEEEKEGEESDTETWSHDKFDRKHKREESDSPVEEKPKVCLYTFPNVLSNTFIL